MPTKLIPHFINGKLTAGQSAAKENVYNPATGQVIRQVPMANDDDITHAVSTAKAALPQWSNLSALKRSRILFTYKALILEHFDELVALITEEHGKVLSDAHGELTRGMEVVEFACGIPYALKGEFSNNVGTRVDSYTLRQSLGVCAGITPFNFPAMVPMWMFPVAIACGNTFVLKPSERDPSVSLKLAELFKQAGLPDGVFNVLHGNKVAVDGLLHHPDVAAISFVGSTPIAQYIYETGAQHGKRVQALGGAKNHCIVMPDADLEAATNGLMGAAYGSAGERCMAISVAVTVGEETSDKIVNRLTARLKTLQVKPGTEKDAEMGPLITKAHLDKVTDLVSQGVKEGASLVVDGRQLNVPGHEKGYFLGGCLFDHVKTEMQIYQQEIFGPVLCVIRVNNFDEAISLINHSPYANGTAIFTRSGAAAREFAQQITVGMVGINIPIPVPMAFHSFGGWKASSFGAHGMHGNEGIHFYTRLKTVTSRWGASDIDNVFVMPTL